MKKTFKLVLLPCLIVLVGTLLLSSCNDKNNTTTHIWSDWITIKEAKCEEKGLLQRYCTECNYTESKPIDALGHTEVINESLAPTCIEGGNTEGKFCSSCGKTFVAQEIIDPLGHTIIIDKEIPPTCTQTGLTEGSYCSTCGEIFKVQKPISPVDFTVTANNRAMIGYTGVEGENLVIPDVFESNGTWYRVTVIGEEAFSNCYNLASVTLPDSVVTICDMAFDNCSKFTSVIIPDSVTFIGSFAFDSCDNLTNVMIGSSVIAIGYKAFCYCPNLTSVTIGNSVTTIGEDAFWACSKLVEVINKSSLNITAASKGNGCVAYYAKEVHNGTTKIVNQNDYLFYTCDGVNYLIRYTGTDTELNLPETYNGQNYEINQYAFNYSTNLTSVTIGDSVTAIGDLAFNDCYNLTSVTIGNSVTSIGERAFSSCNALTSVIIPDSVTIIGEEAFYYCTNLTSATIGNSVTTIGNGAFSLKSITFEGTVAQWKTIRKGFYWNNYTDNYTIYCTDGTVSK